MKCGDCLEILKTLRDSSCDSLVTDPPAGISFMGKGWDGDKGGRAQWVAWLTEVMAECRRVLKPGAHALVWALPRTSHWTMTALEDAGFEIRDVVTHLFGTGFPKSARVNRDPAFCQCVEPGHSGESTNHELPPAHRNGKVAVSPGDDLPREGARRSKSRREDSQADCPPCRDSDDGHVHLAQVTAPASARQPGRVQERSRSAEREDDLGDGQARSLSPAQRTGRPSSPDCLPRSACAGDVHHGKSASKEASASKPTLKGTAPSEHHKPRSFSSPSACAEISAVHEQCQACGKPMANGLGTALKPAAEFWILCRKPISEKTVAKNVLKWGTGALNIDGCRIGTSEVWAPSTRGANDSIGTFKTKERTTEQHTAGRFPANLVLDKEAAAALDEQSLAGGMHSAGAARNKGLAKQSNDGGMFGLGNHESNGVRFGDTGGASRFFYVAKASKVDRGEGNSHPTVKSTKLMSYLVRLVTPPGGIVLDPFMGSGSTGVAAGELGMEFFGIESSAEYFAIAERRLK